MRANKSEQFERDPAQNSLNKMMINFTVKSNKNDFYQYSNFINVSKGYVTFYQMMAIMEKQKAIELIGIIEKELSH